MAVFGWGGNSNGQLGVKNKFEQIQFSFPIKFINCSENTSFAVDINGNAFYWGFEYKGWRNIWENLFKSQELFKPKIIRMRNCAEISLLSKDIIILDNNGIVYYSKDLKDFKEFQYKQKVNHLIRFKKSLFVESNGIFWELNIRNQKPIAYQDNIWFVYLKTYKIITEEFNTVNETIWNHQKSKLENIGKNFFEGKYKAQFDKMGVIGNGGCGVVFEVKHKNSQEYFALKKIEIKGIILILLQIYYYNLYFIFFRF